MNKYVSVSAINKYLAHIFASDNNLSKVYIKGEISNFKAHSSGHFYFSIKDSSSRINAIMFRLNASKLSFTPKEGMKVLVEGSIRVYESSGAYQVYVEDIKEDGVGDLYTNFLELKAKLEKEGLFNKEHKLPIPEYPTRIGIITASTGAAVRDVLSTIERRYPICTTYLFEALVQGENASKSIIERLKEASEYNLDVIIIGRGGGSFEDLNCFNSEELARLIYSINTPVISAVGHEVDFTISDFVSDLRAPTPTGAAELAVPSKIDLINKLNQYKIRLNESVGSNLKVKKLHLDRIKSSYVIKTPNLMYEKKLQQIDTLRENLVSKMTNLVKDYTNKLSNLKGSYILIHPDKIYEGSKNKLSNLIEKLQLVDPMNLIKKGYSLSYVNDKLIKSIKGIKVNDIVTIKLSDGSIKTKVEEII